MVSANHHQLSLSDPSKYPSIPDIRYGSGTPHSWSMRWLLSPQEGTWFLFQRELDLVLARRVHVNRLKKKKKETVCSLDLFQHHQRLPSGQPS